MLNIFQKILHGLLLPWQPILFGAYDSFSAYFYLYYIHKLYILLCVQIVAFCEYAMMTLCDTSALYVLIGIPAALAPIIWGYYSKSKAENTAGGIVYDTAMAEILNKNNVSDEEITNDSSVG